MNHRENFISRWSRRKRHAADEKAQVEKTSVQQALDPSSGQDSNLTPPKSAVASPQVPEFEVASLPPIESIDAGTDITAFFRDGVPTALRRAALRRAWSADPAIRDFIGLNENYWDAANPGGISGFGDLDPKTDVQRMVSDLLGETASEKTGSDSSSTCVTPAAVSRSGSEEGTAGTPDLNTSEAPHSDESKVAALQEAPESKVAALQNELPDGRREQRPVRRHGGALPEQ